MAAGCAELGASGWMTYLLAFGAPMSAFANMPISSKLAAAFAAVVTVIFLSGAIIYSRLGVLEETLNQHLQTDLVGEPLDAIEEALLEQEAGVHGYLATGDESFLERYHRGGDAFKMAVRNAEAVTADDPVLMGRLDELNELAKQWWVVAEREIALMANPATREDARAVMRSRAGESVRARIRAAVAEIDAVEADISAKDLAVHRQQEKAYASTYTVTILGGAASLVLATIMGFLLTRGVTAPVRRMTSAMAELAKGDTSVEVPGVGRKDEIGAMAAAVQIFRDRIIDRNRAEKALQESEEKWRAIFENSPTRYFMIDAAGTVLSVNPFGAEQLGYTVDELMGGSVLKIFYEEDREAAQRNTTACIEQPSRAFHWELRKVRKDGSVLRVRETAKAMQMKERPVVLVVSEDIT
jgi:PAS domain S-box-containing protein